VALTSLVPLSRRVRELVRFGSSVGCTLQTAFSTFLVLKVQAIDQLIPWAPKIKALAEVRFDP